MIGLNIPPCIPPKIAVGGIENLTDANRRFLPKTLHLQNPAYRAYLQKTFEMHHLPHVDFENFYVAQNVWDDAMAEAIAAHLDDRVMVVFAGNGHLISGFGIPGRVPQQPAPPYRIVLPLPAGKSVEPDAADYIWVTAPEAAP